MTLQRFSFNEFLSESDRYENFEDLFGDYVLYTDHVGLIEERDRIILRLEARIQDLSRYNAELEQECSDLERELAEQ